MHNARDINEDEELNPSRARPLCLMKFAIGDLPRWRDARERIGSRLRLRCRRESLEWEGKEGRRSPNPAAPQIQCDPCAVKNFLLPGVGKCCLMFSSQVDSVYREATLAFLSERDSLPLRAFPVVRPSAGMGTQRPYP